jgi:hypothetical protein
VAHEKTVYPSDFAKSCANCKYCDTITNPVQAVAQMFCRRNAPSSAGQCIGIDPATKQPQWVYSTLWPVVGSQDWCGEHARKVNA